MTAQNNLTSSFSVFLVDSLWLSGLCKGIMIKILSTENGEMPQWLSWSAFLLVMYFITMCVQVC